MHPVERRFNKPYVPRLVSRKDFSSVTTFGVPAPVILPDQLLSKRIALYDQGDKPSCTAAASVTCRTIMNGKLYSEPGQWNLELGYKNVLEAPDGFGLDVPSAVGLHVGFSVPGYAVAQDKVGGYFFNDALLPGLDFFDTLRTTMFQTYQRTGKIVPWQVGVNWFSSFDTVDGIVPIIADTLLGGHDTTICGWTSIAGIPYLVNANSWGDRFGDNGYFYFSREAANQCFNLGAFYSLEAADMPPPDDVVRLGIFAAILKNIKAIFQLILNYRIQPSVPPIAPVPPIDTTPPSPAPIPPATAPVYLWDTPERARMSVRMLCDALGLTVAQKDALCATVACESGFDVDAVHQNIVAGNVVSTDSGIAQWNDFYHGKEISAHDAIHDPEKAIRLMIAYWQEGKADTWVCYKTGEYKKFL